MPTQEEMSLEVVREQPLAVVQQPTPAMILHEAVQRGADVGVIERLVALQERMERNDAEKAFYEAKARIHAKIPRIHESGAIVIRNEVQSRYAKYEDIDAVLRPLLDEEGFSLDFDAKWDGDRLAMTGTLAHRKGHRETKSLPMPIDISGSKNKTQAIGSTVSYGRRYLVTMLLNLVTENQDDDGNGGGNQFITQSQADEITGMLKTLEELGHPSRDSFLRWIGASAVAEIRAADCEKAMAMLKRKLIEVGPKK